jgi:maltose alpha-D-glucosyltransferase/alpha-amylase
MMTRFHQPSVAVTAIPAAAAPSDPQWYKDAVIYQVHVKAFRDSNDDGIGDFPGLTQSLPYVKDLGVNTIWLLPFYRSPLRDDGYDIADYHGVHPQYGTLADFRHFMREAHRLGLRVITELVINHTSDQHPWFQAARNAPRGSSKRDFYVWSDNDTQWPETRIIFTDTEKSNWTWDPVAKQYYWHRFFSHQPDLNFRNPTVTRAVIKVMRYWLDMGVDGLRLDAIPYLVERDGTNNENLPETHDVLKQIRAELDKRYDNRFFLAEVNQWPEDVRPYFGEGDECHMAFHFPLMPRVFMALAEEDRHAIVDIMSQTPDIPDTCQWAIFLRNHDELTLEMVTARERDYLYRTYASDRQMRINVGIRRRLAPLMENNRPKIELLNSVLMSLIGSPVMYYGDEIGMGDNIFLGDRNGVRTPMQWSPDRNAGFSRADPQRLYLPPLMDAVYGYAAVNVEAQSRSSASLLNWCRRLIAVRRAHPALSRGTLKFSRPGNRKILAYLREHGGEVILCVANLSRASQPVELDLSAYKGRVPVELLGNTAFPPIGELPYLLTLPAWGFYWFSLTTDAAYPKWHAERPVPVDLPLLVIPEGLMAALMTRDTTKSDLRALMARRVREQLEREVLPLLLPHQRWFAGKGRTIERAEVLEQDEWTTAAGSWLLAMAQVQFTDGKRHTYSLPLAVAWEEGDGERLQALRHCTVARLRQRARVGVVYDAYWDDSFCLGVVAAMRRGDVRRMKNGELRFASTQRLADVEDFTRLPIQHPAFEQSNSLVVLGERLVLKGYRRLRPGINPEIEIGRFLTEVSPFPYVAALYGSLEHCDGAGTSTAIAVLLQYVPNEGNGWDYAIGHLRRLIDNVLAQPPVIPAPDMAAAAPIVSPAPAPVVQEGDAASVHAGFVALIGTLGRRTAELHRALARPSGDPAFEPEPLTSDDLAALRDKLAAEAEATLQLLAKSLPSLATATRADAERLLAQRDTLIARARRAVPDAVDAMKTRYHGDYHLGQVLLRQHEFYIVDFEGEPSRPLDERRAKHSPLRDVAGMLRSFAYAAAFAAQQGITVSGDDRAKLAAPLAAWRAETSTAFLSGYHEAISGAASSPADPALAQRLIDAFVLEKSLYELRYELGNRPDWIAIPLAAVLEQLAEDAS